MELLPMHAFSTPFPVLQDNLEVYLRLQQIIVTSGSGQGWNNTAEKDCRWLHCSLLQAMGYLAEYFIKDVLAARFNDALTVAYSHWLAQYCSEAHQQNTQQFVTFIPTTMNAITPLISTKASKQQSLHLLSNSVSPSVPTPIY
ncbi:hypothetical protein H8959_016486 [Pygathrix nigripes]